MNNDQELINFCRNVRRIRKEKGISQRRMAAIMGIGVESLRKIEAGIVPARLGIHAVYSVCAYFRISSDALVSGDVEL